MRRPSDLLERDLTYYFLPLPFLAAGFLVFAAVFALGLAAFGFLELLGMSSLHCVLGSTESLARQTTCEP